MSRVAKTSAAADWFTKEVQAVGDVNALRGADNRLGPGSRHCGPTHAKHPSSLWLEGSGFGGPATRTFFCSAYLVLGSHCRLDR